MQPEAEGHMSRTANSAITIRDHGARINYNNFFFVRATRDTADTCSITGKETVPS